VILQVDHIVAVANGGSNGQANLATACQECNSGKSAVPLSSVPPSLFKQRKATQERRAQADAYSAWLRESFAATERDVDEIADLYAEHVLEQGWTLSSSARSSVRMFLESLPKERLVQAVLLTSGAAPKDPFRYFCAVCWNWIKGRRS
jgi:hypothetical protein